MALTDILRKAAAGAVVCVGLAGCAFKNYDVSRMRDAPAVEQTNDRVGQFVTVTWNEVQERISTPMQAQNYCDFLRERALVTGNVDDGSHYYGPKRVQEGAPVDCSEAAFSVAGALFDDGYEPVILVVGQEEVVVDESGAYKPAHTVFIYRQNGRFGSVGLNQSDFHHPVFESVNDLARAIADSYKDEGYDMTRYAVINIEENNADFITTDENMYRDVNLEFEIE